MTGVLAPVVGLAESDAGTSLVPPEVKDVRIAGIAGLGQKAGGGPRVASTRHVGRIQVVKAGNKGEGSRGLRIWIAG